MDSIGVVSMSSKFGSVVILITFFLVGFFLILKKILKKSGSPKKRDFLVFFGEKKGIAKVFF
jgi:hypothetical protein